MRRLMISMGIAGLFALGVLACGTTEPQDQPTVNPTSPQHQPIQAEYQRAPDLRAAGPKPERVEVGMSHTPVPPPLTPTPTPMTVAEAGTRFGLSESETAELLANQPTPSPTLMPTPTYTPEEAEVAQALTAQKRTVDALISDCYGHLQAKGQTAFLNCIRRLAPDTSVDWEAEVIEALAVR